MSIAREKNVGTSPWKLRRVINLIRGLPVDDAENILRTTPTPISKTLLKLLLSAIANAENNDGLPREGLRVTYIVANQGRTLRRFRPKARGRAGAFNHPSSHITIQLEAS